MCDHRPGLGNRMFPWARAEVFAAAHSVPMIAPQWAQFKLGPMLRRETDLRYYLNLFTSKGYVRGPARWHALLRTPRVKGETAEQMMQEGRRDELEGKVIDFRGYEGWFRDDLQHHRDLVRRRLDAITAKGVKKQVAEFAQPTEIVAHVRRGDMRVLNPGEEFGTQTAVAEREEYFIAVIEQIRAELGDLPVTIFSNSRPGELTLLPKVSGLTVAPISHAPLTDIWLMSRATVLIASSLSSFSAWASYLGGMPTVWCAPKRIPLVPEHPEYAIEVGPDGAMSADDVRTIGAYAAQRDSRS